MEGKVTLFLSYCSKDESIANIIDNDLHEQIGDILKITRYTRDVGYRESFKEFMNRIGEHDYVLSIVSDSYLKSAACMYEVGEVLNDHNFTEKLLFVVLSEEDRACYSDNYSGKIKADIYSPVKRAKYSIYWQEQYNALDKEIKKISDCEATRELSNELAAIRKILDFDLERFIAYLSDANGMTFSKLRNNNFNEIIKCIIPDYNNSIFKECDSYEKLFEVGIKQIYKITNTDYNQIILFANLDSHSSGLIVVADIISEFKQRYRTVAVDGIIYSAYRSGETINISDVNKNENYFCAVSQTKSELAVPIKIKGNTVGVINIESQKIRDFSEKKIFEVELLANLFGIALSKIGYDTINENSIPYMPFTIQVKKKD